MLYEQTHDHKIISKLYIHIFMLFLLHSKIVLLLQEQQPVLPASNFLSYGTSYTWKVIFQRSYYKNYGSLAGGGLQHRVTVVFRIFVVVKMVTGRMRVSIGTQEQIQAACG